MGGNDLNPSLLPRYYSVRVSCLRVNIKTGDLAQRADMNSGRYAFGTCQMGQFIYVVGGRLDDYNLIASCERYDIFANKWTQLSQLTDTYTSQVTVESIKKRLIYGFGGRNADLERPQGERILRLDTLKLWKGWATLNLISPTNGYSYGVFPLKTDGDYAEFLVFGGCDSVRNMNRSCVFSTNLFDFRKSNFTLLTGPLS